MGEGEQKKRDEIQKKKNLFLSQKFHPFFFAFHSNFWLFLCFTYIFEFHQLLIFFPFYMLKISKINLKNKSPKTLTLIWFYVGDGSDKDHIWIGLTSRKLLSRINEAEGHFHIDCTYKVLKYNFPLLVFGFSAFYENKRRFYPIAFMICHTKPNKTLNFFLEL